MVEYGLWEYQIIEDKLDRVGRRASAHEINYRSASSTDAWLIGRYLFDWVLLSIYRDIQQFTNEGYKSDLMRKFDHHRLVRQESTLWVNETNTQNNVAEYYTGTELD